MATLFTRILQEEIPSVRIYEDEQCVAILDIAPINKGHFLVISRDEHETILDCPNSLLSHMMVTAKQLAANMVEKLGCDGFNIMINNGSAAGQEVPHVHIHVIPRFSNDGKSPSLAKETYGEQEMISFGKLLSE